MATFKRASIAQPSHIKIVKKAKVKPQHEFESEEIDKIVKNNSNRDLEKYSLESIPEP